MLRRPCAGSRECCGLQKEVSADPKSGEAEVRWVSLRGCRQDGGSRGCGATLGCWRGESSRAYYSGRVDEALGQTLASPRQKTPTEALKAPPSCLPWAPPSSVCSVKSPLHSQS
ncbi:hypothetical protein NDU88_001041 [Pleurodeles waltl]|uniref:Uncharacterized protein n=1 Tax=Pleurodeles waltl TaxID=8319 RepID=A0AAV7RAH3_PLEWA|nr:hypothetical protein NDU88_001041 [Pleurodeles waltl]